MRSGSEEQLSMKSAVARYTAKHRRRTIEPVVIAWVDVVVSSLVRTAKCSRPGKIAHRSSVISHGVRCKVPRSTSACRRTADTEFRSLRDLLKALEQLCQAFTQTPTSPEHIDATARCRVQCPSPPCFHLSCVAQ